MTEEQVEEYIRKALQAGISTEQITDDLLIKGVEQTTIDLAMATVATGVASKGPAPSPASFLVSIGFILVGIFRLTAYPDSTHHILGFIFIAVGIIGLILKSVAKG